MLRAGLLSLVERYALTHDISRGYRVQLEIAARSFERFAPLADWAIVCDDLVNLWLVDQQEAGSTAVTIHAKRRAFLTLWRYANECGLCSVLPNRVRRINVPETVPVAFLAAEVSALVAAAKLLRGLYAKIGVPKSLWWSSFLLAGYDTALRLGDLLSLERRDIWPGGRICIVQHKTGQSHSVQLRPQTIEAIDASMGYRPMRALIWPLWCQRNRWYGHFARLRDSAGLSAGTSKWIRRSSASYVERDHPGMASKHLGHRSSELANKHYLDQRICGSEPILPPEL